MNNAKVSLFNFNNSSAIKSFTVGQQYMFVEFTSSEQNYTYEMLEPDTVRHLITFAVTQNSSMGQLYHYLISNNLIKALGKF
jgi:hypothetical protein